MVFHPFALCTSISLLAKEVFPTLRGAANIRLLYSISVSAFCSSAFLPKKSSPATGEPIFNFSAIVTILFIVFLSAKIIIYVQTYKKIAKKLYSNLKFATKAVLFTLFDSHLFQFGNIQMDISAYFLVLSSFQNFQLIIDAVGLFTDTHLDVFLKYSF